MRTNIIIVLMTLITTLPLGACSNLQGAIAQTARWRDEAIGVRDALDQRIVAMESELTELDPDTPHARQIDADLRAARAKHAALDAAIARADLVLREAADPSSPITGLAHDLSAWVPAPAQGALVLGAALIATLARSRRIKESGESIVDSIAHVLERDGQLRDRFASHADTIRSIQTRGARRMVDRAQRRRGRSGQSLFAGTVSTATSTH